MSLLQMGPFGVPTPESVFVDYEEKQKKKEKENLSNILNAVFNHNDKDPAAMYLNNIKIQNEAYKERAIAERIEAENRREELNIRRIEAENENLRLKLELEKSKSHLINPIIRI